MVRRSSTLILAIVAMLAVAAIDSRAQSMLTHHMREAVRSGRAKPVGRLPATQVLQLNMVLPLGDPIGLGSFLRQLYDPASPSYRHFLSVQEFTERFGPSQARYDAVVRFAKANHFAVVGGSRDGMEVQIRASVADIERGFHLKMRVYQRSGESRRFYAPDSEPTTSLAFPLWHISGLDNDSNPHAMFVRKSEYAKAHGLRPAEVVSYATTGSGPSASFLGSDLRAAYYGGTTLTGAGQNVGLLEYAGTDLADLATYFRNIGQTNNVPITLDSTDGTSTSCEDTSAGGNCDDAEQTLDMTQAIGMAPGMASLVMYIGSTDTAIISAMTTHDPLPMTIGCSWGWTPEDASTLDPYFERMAAQGQNFFVASGDDSTWSSSNGAWPADDANVVAVGGTDLMTASAGGAWQSETAWLDSGGGSSPDGIDIPAWQLLPGVINANNQGSTTLRNGPDVAANANFTFYVCADQTACTANEYGGTSFAAPLWAGFVALVNQQLAGNGEAAIGFLNPTIYAQDVTPNYATEFHDITSGTSGSYSAVVGYDLVTGWGTPNGAGLIDALAPGATASNFTLSVSPTVLSVARKHAAIVTVRTRAWGGFHAGISLSASGESRGETVTFSPGEVAPGGGSATLVVDESKRAAAGSHRITITAAGGGRTQSTRITIEVVR